MIQPKIRIGYYNSEGYPVTVPQTIAEKAAEKLDSIETLVLNEDAQKFVDTKNDREKEIFRSISANKKELIQIQTALEQNKKRDGIHDELLRWLRIKNNEGILLQQEVKLLDEITSILTNIEAAKYLAQAKAIEDSIRFLPYFDSEIVKSEKQLFSSRNKIEGKHKILPSYTNKADNFVYLDNRKPNHVLKKHLIVKSTENNENFVKPISYIQKVISLDTDGIEKLILKVKKLINNEISEKEELVTNSERLGEIEKKISKRTTFQNNHNLISNQYMTDIKNDLEQSKRRLWAVKEIEWVVTQIETSKYLAKLRQTNSNDNDFTKELNVLMES
ncbi:hypothetical protein HZS_4009 [Henneguya salminicola]|nr:hypothetical protein HZS_4009 [Henneguya salminicola]